MTRTAAQQLTREVTGQLPRSGRGWVSCPCGQRHWGIYGAAGMFLWRRTAGRLECLLHHRSRRNSHGGTWSIPGGALNGDELPLDAALRETQEEVGITADSLRVHAHHTLAHPVWRYTTVIAQAAGTHEPATTDPETLDALWVPVDRVASYRLLPAFADALPALARAARTEAAS